VTFNLVWLVKVEVDKIETISVMSRFFLQWNRELDACKQLFVSCSETEICQLLLCGGD